MTTEVIVEERSAPPEMPDIHTWIIMAIPVGELFIDRRYQRGLVKGQVRRLVEEWDWDKYHPISVSHRVDGRYAVIAGQQRTTAAIELGIPALPAVLHTRTSIEKEAKSYLGSGATANITASDRFKARLIAKDEKAYAIWGEVEQCGFSLRCIREDEPGYTADPFTIDAVYALETIFDVGYLIKTLNVISESWGNQPVKDMIQGNMLREVYLAIRHLEQSEISTEEFIKSLKKVSVKDVLDKGYDRYRSMVHSRSIDAGVAAVLVDQFNYRRKEQAPEFSKHSSRAWSPSAGGKAAQSNPAVRAGLARGRENAQRSNGRFTKKQG